MTRQRDIDATPADGAGTESVSTTTEADAPGGQPAARPATRRRGWLLLAGGAALVAVALGIVLYQLWPDISYSLGLVDDSWPYASRFVGTLEADEIPKGKRIVIPKIGVDAQVAGGNADVALSQGVYHHVETAEPGEGDNVALAGHRSRQAFVLLYQLDPGDPVSLWWDGEEHTYRVTRIYTVTPDDQSVLAGTDEERLTLYTCLPRFLGNERTVVEAEVAEEPAQP
jgi:LPXTG-site transpeptidase (sortase) family protein